MVQRADGGWEPHKHSEPDGAIPPPPWEQPDQSHAEPVDGEVPSAPTPQPDPNDGPLGGSGDDAA